MCVCVCGTVSSLKSLSQEVLDLLKAQAGHDVFMQIYVIAQKTIFDKREGRKRQRAVDVSAANIFV